MVKLGEKKVDLRLLDHTVAQIKPGDVIIYTIEFDANKSCKVTVTDIKVFKDFDALLEATPLSALGRQNKDLIRVNLNRFYSEEDRSKHSAVAIWIENYDM